jgi:5-methylcytosine-specific restriction endonuclease McrA
MPSLAHEHRKQLEAYGEYVTRANVGWFAIFPKTLELREAVARGRGRSDINLVVYRTASGDRRDHHVIPISIAKQLLSDETLSDSVTGEKRWNMVLANDVDRLKVTHGDHDIDVSPFRGIQLITEATPAFDPAEPVEDEAELDARVSELQARSDLTRPIGTSSPTRQPRSASQSPFARRPDVKTWVLRQASGHCELCTFPAPFQSAHGEPYLEHHHVLQLAHGGSDTIENSVALCPNCHRRLHHGADRDEQRERLYTLVDRLVRESQTSDEGG